MIRNITILASLSLAGIVQAATTGIGPLPYTSAADSPFLTNPSLVLEDFEDGALNAPGIVNREIIDEQYTGVYGLGIVLAPGPQTDSVDVGGRSFRSTFFIEYALDGSAYSVLSFRLAPNASGQYPTDFGFVWTDGEPGSYFQFVIIEKNGTSAEGAAFEPYDPLGDLDQNGGTAEDRFFGFTSDVGIERVTFHSFYPQPLDYTVGGRMSFIEIDHLQFAYPVPEPGWSVAALLALGLVRRRACRRTR